MANETNCNRREFLENSAAGAAGVAAGMIGLGTGPSAVGADSASVLSALRVGVIGLGQQGLELAELFAAQPDVRVVSLCDVDTRALGQAIERLEAITPIRPEVTSQHELMLDRRDVDAVVIATPDHWHARQAIDACVAGKDLYVEPPLGLCPDDGRRMCAAAERSRRVVQVGLPQRSGAHFRSAIQLIQSGQLGSVKLAKAWAVHKRRSIAACATASPPRGVDYERWLGPAPKRAFQANRFHRTWPWFWDYGSGELGLWGVQLLDVVRWGMGVEVPLRVAASGGKRFFRDDRETPDTLTVQYDFGDTTVLWEHRQWSRHGIDGRTAAAAFHGEAGTLIIDRSGWKVYDSPESLYAESSEIRQSHIRDFIEAVRVRGVPSADVRTAWRSSNMCHLGNLSWRLGRELVIDPLTGMPGPAPDVERILTRVHRDPWQLPEA